MTTFSSDESSVGRPIHSLSHYVLQTSINSLRVGDLWADSGCVRAVGGRLSHEALKKKMATLGIKPVMKRTHDSFQFGNGDVSEATQKALYPVFLRGEFRGLLDIAEVPPHCPMLMSKNVLKKWNVDMCFGPGCLKIQNFDVTIPFNEHDVPVVNILDVTKEQLKRQWNLIPDMCKLSNPESNPNGNAVGCS